MSLQYSGGTLINRTFIPTTRLEWVQNVTQALSDAGWTTISGTPGTSADVTQESAAQNSSAKIRFRFFDPATGNCAQVTMKHPSGSLTSLICYALPTAGSGQWRIIASKFHWFAFATGNANATAIRGWIYGGTIYTPSFLGIVSGDGVGFLQGGGTTDIDGTARIGWRRQLRPSPSNHPNESMLWVATIVDVSASVANGNLALGLWQGGSSTQDVTYRWEDNSLQAYEPMVSWATGSASSNEAKIKGQLYDAMVISGVWTGESTFTFDGHTWLVITDAATTAQAATASLALVIP